jgi:hypothetical protein
MGTTGVEPASVAWEQTGNGVLIDPNADKQKKLRKIQPCKLEIP